MKLPAYKLTPTHLEVPEACPNCGADFTTEGNLTEGNWCDGYFSAALNRSPAVGEGPVGGHGHLHWGDDFRPFGYYCNACNDWSISAQEEEG